MDTDLHLDELVRWRPMVATTMVVVIGAMDVQRTIRARPDALVGSKRPVALKSPSTDKEE